MKSFILTLVLFIPLLSGCTSPTKEPMLMMVQEGVLYMTGFHQHERRARVVVIDTGLNPSLLRADYMCKDVAQLGFDDQLKPDNMHGTNIVSIIQEGMNIEKYCITMIKVDLTNRIVDEFALALKYPRALSNTYTLNLSLVTYGYKHGDYQLIKSILRSGIKVNAAAGNDGTNLDPMCSIYLACFGKLLERENKLALRANLKIIGAFAPYSNYGDVVDIFLPGGPMGTPPMQGTSMATALYTNILVRD